MRSGNSRDEKRGDGEGQSQLTPFVAALGVFFTWELFAPYPGKPPPIIGRILDRFGYAVGALIFDLVLVMSLWNGVKQLLGIKESPPSSRGRPASPR